jgi:hypothetical protein
MRIPPIVREPVMLEPPVQPVVGRSKAKTKKKVVNTVNNPHRYKTQMGRDIGAEHARITARMFDPDTSAEQLDRDRLRLEILGRLIESERSRNNEELEKLYAQEARMEATADADWKEHHKEHFVRKCFKNLAYLVVAQRVGHHLFKD